MGDERGENHHRSLFTGRIEYICIYPKLEVSTCIFLVIGQLNRDTDFPDRGRTGTEVKVPIEEMAFSVSG